MTDPFSPAEASTQTTLRILEILRLHDYPTVISTKGTLPACTPYVDILRGGNFYVRFSVSVVSENVRHWVEGGNPSTDQIFRAAYTLAREGVPTAIRFQPIVPGHELAADDLIKRASNSGVRHVSAEYLKAPVEAHNSSAARLNRVFGEECRKMFRRYGARRVGREFVLPIDVKLPRLLGIREKVKSHGLTFGFGDNELIPYSDGSSCCSGSDLYLRGYRLFDANCAHLIAQKSNFDSLYFSDFNSAWIPDYPITPHLNSNSTVPHAAPKRDWIAYLARDWNGNGLYGPSFFHGVEFTGKVDGDGHKIYAKSGEIS